MKTVKQNGIEYRLHEIRNPTAAQLAQRLGVTPEDVRRFGEGVAAALFRQRQEAGLAFAEPHAEKRNDSDSDRQSEDTFQPALCLFVEGALRAEAEKQGRGAEYERRFGQGDVR